MPAIATLRSTIEAASQNLVARESLVELVVLCAVAGEHLLVLGPPGTAKSAAVRRAAEGLGGRYFEYLLGRFTEPSELFGPIDLRKLKEGVVETSTEGMLPEAEFAFLDELFLGSTAILNTLLGILNERSFRRGQTRVRCPLRVCVAASNRLPEEPELAAVADRFLARMYIASVGDCDLEALLRNGRAVPLFLGAAPGAVAPRSATTSELSPLEALDTVAALARAVDLGPVVPALAEAFRTLRNAGVNLSDRRMVRAQSLVAAAAALAGRTEAAEADLWPLIYVLPTEEDQVRGRTLLRDLLKASESRLLAEAAADASLGLLARVEPLVREYERLMSDEEPRLRPWRLRAEGILREIDATFGEGELPERLVEVREGVRRALLGTGPSTDGLLGTGPSTDALLGTGPSTDGLLGTGPSTQNLTPSP